jgi:IclR family acetate operon transcriptional repressor
MKTVANALGILRLFEAAEKGLSVAEVTAKTGLAKSKVSRLLSVCRDAGFLDQDPSTRRYVVGSAPFKLGAVFAKTHPLTSSALPIMRELVEWCKHTTTLSIMTHDEIVHLLAVEGPMFLDGRWRTGSVMPYWASSAGKIITARLPEKELDALMERRPPYAITPITVTDPAELKRQLKKANKMGFVISRGESVTGLAAIAVPVFGVDDKFVASLGLIIPDHIFDLPNAESLTNGLHRAARRLSIQIGANFYPFGN